MAVQFDGVDDVILASSAGGSSNIAIKTIAAWVYLDAHCSTAAVYRIAVSKCRDEDNGWLLAARNDNNSSKAIFFGQAWTTANGRWSGPGNSISTGAWTHLAVTYALGASGNAPNLFVNGSSVVVSTVTAPQGTIVSDGDEQLALGSFNTVVGGSSRLWEGQLEDVRIFNRALSANEIASLAAGYRGALGGEVAWWPLVGPNGALATGAANVFDLSGNGLHGTPQGGSSYAASIVPRMSGWIP